MLQRRVDDMKKKNDHLTKSFDILKGDVDGKLMEQQNKIYLMIEKK